MRKRLKSFGRALYACAIGVGFCLNPLAGEAGTYYLIGKDASGASSLGGSTAGAGWSATRGGTTKDHNFCTAGNDYVIDGSIYARPPDIDGDFTVACNSLTLTNGGTFAMVTRGNKSLIIPNLISYSGSFGTAARTGMSAPQILAGGLHIPEGGSFGTWCDDNDGRSLELNSTVTGSGLLTLQVTAGSKSNTQLYLGGDLSGFTGNLVVSGNACLFNLDSAVG